MRKSGTRIIRDVDRIHSEPFALLCRNGNANVFVRNRKMPLDDLTFSMINRKGLTLKLELRGYMNISHPGIQISKPGYLKQRMKLNPEAFVDLYQFHNRNFYSDPETEFTGTKPILLEQDIFSTIYVSNIAEDIARDIEQEQADHLKNDYKHRMAVNRTLCIGLLKSDLIYILLEKDRHKQDELFQQLYDEISENIVPVRPDRHYHRTKGQLVGNYSNTHKRSF